MSSQSGRDARAGLVLLCITGLIWGTIGAAARLIYDRSDLSALEITWLRTAFAAPFCLAAGWFMLGRRLFAISRRGLLIAALLAMTVFAYQALYLVGIKEVGVTVATIICLSSIPVLVAIFSATFLHEKPHRIVVVAMVATVLGTVLLTLSQDAGDTHGSLWLGVGASFASGIGGAIYSVGSQVMMRTLKPIQVLALGFPVAAVVFAPFMRGAHVGGDLSISVWLLLAYLGVGTQGIAYLLFQRGLQTETATVASIVTLLEPLLAAILGWILFEERLGSLGFVGAAIMLGGLLLVTFAPRGRAKLEIG